MVYSQESLRFIPANPYCISVNKRSLLSVRSMTPELALSFNPHGVIRVLCAYRVLVTLRNVERRSRSTMEYVEKIHS